MTPMLRWTTAEGTPSVSIYISTGSLVNLIDIFGKTGFHLSVLS